MCLLGFSAELGITWMKSVSAGGEVAAQIDGGGPAVALRDPRHSTDSLGT